MFLFVRRMSLQFGAALTVSLLMLGIAGAQSREEGRSDIGRPNLDRAFIEAAAKFEVPVDILRAVAFSETRFDGHNGEPSSDNGFGIMHLTDNDVNQTLRLAAELTGYSEKELRTENDKNIFGGAAVLAYLAKSEGVDRSDVSGWFPAVARYSGSTDEILARFYADHVYELLNNGFTGTSPGGETITVYAEQIEPRRGRFESVPEFGTDNGAVASTDYGPALWSAAHSSNYTTANRETTYPINYVIIHTTQGSYAGAISWFKNASANVSAHYVIRSNDGQITQTVREKDVAWHAGNWTYNTQSVGIEHEGYVNNASWYTDAMYRASAALTRNVCQKYGIPMTRSRIIGHNEVPGATHTDPGPHWNWSYYMQLVTQSSEWSTIVDNSSSGFSASGNWGVSTYSSQRYGSNYHYANPVSASDAAWYSANLPATGNYEVYVWYAANSGYNDKTPYVVVTTSGNVTVNVNQRLNGGQWRSIGTHRLAGGNGAKVGVSRWTNGTGYVIADAVRFVRR